MWENRYEGPVFGDIPDAWSGIYCFAFVRHPLDRFISAFSDFKQLRNYAGTIEDFSEIVLDETIIYDARRSRRAERIRHHCIPQTHPFNCLALSHDIYRYESFKAEVTRLTDKLGHQFTALPRRRKTEHAHWTSLLERDLTMKLVGFYEKDFIELDYPLP